MNSISVKGMIPSSQQQRENPTPNTGATHTKRTTNNSIESWGKRQQHIHRHDYQNISPDNDPFCDPYHILHIRRDATKYEMKRSYQQLALLYHPSLTTTMMMHHNVFSHEAHKQELLFLFTLIAASYETLSIKETRQRMDMILLQQQQQKDKKNQIQIQHTSTKSEKHKISSPKQNNKDDKSNGSNIINISKAEYKIRKRLREERRVQQQQRRINDSNKAKHNKNKLGEAQRTSQPLKPQSTPLKIVLSPSSSTASSYNYHHHHVAQQIDDDSARDDNSSARPSRHNMAATKAKKGKFHSDSNGIPCSREHRKSQKRGYNWAYLPSPPSGCPHDEATDNDIRNNEYNRIPFDEPFDRVDDYYCPPGTSTTTIPTVVHHSSNDHSNHSNVIPPPLVGSSDSEVNDNDNDSDYLLSLQNITKDFYNVNRPKSTTNTTDAKERWFGGPLKLMHHARKFQPFTDPFELFERTFRSGLIVPEQQRQLASFSTSCEDSNRDNSNHRIVGLLPMNGIVSPSTLDTFSSNRNVVPISAADDAIETLADGTIVTRTYRTVPITTTTTEHQQETLYKTLTRTITRYPPPLDPYYQNSSNHHCRMTVSVTSDVAVRVDQKSLLKSSTSFGNNYKNHCADCIGWMNCQSTESHAKAATISNNHHDDGYFSFKSMLQSWLPSC